MHHRGPFFGIGILLIWLVACGGDDRSPTDPGPRLPSIAGSWTGVWGVDIFGFRSNMDLVQGQNGRVTGTLRIDGFPTPIEGSVTPTRFSWHLAGVANSDCPNFIGDLDLVFAEGAVIRMTGTATEYDRPCLPNGTETRGLMSLSRAGS